MSLDRSGFAGRELQSKTPEKNSVTGSRKCCYEQNSGKLIRGRFRHYRIRPAGANRRANRRVRLVLKVANHAVHDIVERDARPESSQALQFLKCWDAPRHIFEAWLVGLIV